MLLPSVAIELVTAHGYPHVFNLPEFNIFFPINCTGRTARTYCVVPDSVLRNCTMSFSSSYYKI